MTCLSTLFDQYKVNKMTEKRPWTQEEDRLLKMIYETSRLTKWSHIARRLQEDHGIKGRNGKQCKERYITHINTNHPKEDWVYSDEQRLFQLHNELGNKWAIIGSKLQGRSDNCVKNHFHSKLKRALKKLNRVILSSFKKQYKEIKLTVLHRIVEVVEEKFKEIPKFDKQFSSFSNKLKNELLDFSYDDEVEQGKEQQNINIEQAREIIDNLVLFGQDYKKKNRKTKVGQEQDLLTPNRYHYKTRRCNSQNEQSEGSSSMMHSSDTSNFQDISDDQINRTNNKSKASRKNSQEYSGSNRLPVYRIRTRAYSQGNSRDNSQSQDMKDERDQQKQKKQLQEQLQYLNIFQEEDIIPPHPLLMKKQTSKYSRYSQNVIQKEQYHFFEDSEIEMRILPEMVMGVNKESQYEQNIFN